MKFLHWPLLILLSVVLGGGLHLAGLPAAWLLGPMVAGVALQGAGASLRVPGIFLQGAQAVIGCLVARMMTPAILSGFVQHWPVFIGAVLASILAAAGIGWGMARLRIISGSTAVWGMLPGAASAMILLSEAYGADFRLVAFMQYLRVAMVVGAASLVALCFTHGGGGHAALGLLAPVNWRDFAETIGVAVIGGALGVASRVPAGLLLAPMLLGAVLEMTGVVHIELPAALLIMSYAVVGWSTGLRFSRQVLMAAWRALPQAVGATLVLILVCAGLAWLLVATLHVDPLTAYLATSPGGADAAAIIAASSKRVDMSFVMAMQVMRFVLLLLVGPWIARRVAGTLKA